MSGREQAGIPCNLCGEAEVAVLAEAGRSGEALRTVACNICGLVWSDPRPHDTREFYREHYRKTYKNAFEPKPKHVLRAGQVAVSRLRQIHGLLRAGMRVLDVGSGGGEFAYLIKRTGHAVEGVEPNLGYAGYSVRQYGLDVRTGFIDEVGLPAAGYDLITVWHVLEHTENPLLVLQRLRAALSAGGRLVVEVPNLEGPRRNRCSTFHEAHLYNFNEATLAAMGARAGLDLVSMTPSTDGGNLLAVFKQGVASTVETVTARLQHNPDRVLRSVLGQKPWQYWLSARPYRRMLQHCWRPVAEMSALRANLPARERLDGLYAAAMYLRPESHPLSPWAVIGSAYLIAVLLEWVLLDMFLPDHGWSEQQGFWLFTALLCGAAGLAWNVMRGSRSRRQMAGIAALTSPLFALPIYC